MVDFEQVQTLLKGLMAEFDTVTNQREEVRKQENHYKAQGIELDRKLTGLKQSIEGLSLYSTAKNAPPELTETKRGIMESIAAMQMGLAQPQRVTKSLVDCCREILLRSGEWLTALQVRQGLHAAGFDFSEYKSNPLSSIHTTLKRIAEAGQAWIYPDAGGETLYRWKKQGETTAPIQELVAQKAAKAIIASRKRSETLLPTPKTPAPVDRSKKKMYGE